MKFEIFKIAILTKFCKMSTIEMFLKKRTSVNKNKLGWRDEKKANILYSYHFKEGVIYFRTQLWFKNIL